MISIAESDRIHFNKRNLDQESTSLSWSAGYQDRALMGLDDMFDNGQSQTGSTKFSASGHIDTVKSLENSFMMLGFNPEAI